MRFPSSPIKWSIKLRQLGRYCCYAASHAVCCYRCSMICIPVCLCMCLLVTTISSVKVAQVIEMPFGVQTHVGQRNSVLGGPDPRRGRGNFGGITRPVVKYKEYPAHGRCSQPYSVGGSSHAACCCQYCSNLIRVV